MARIYLTSIEAVEAVRAGRAGPATARTVGPGAARCIARHLDYTRSPAWAFANRVPALSLHASDLAAARNGRPVSAPCHDIRRRLIARWTSWESIRDLGGYGPGRLEVYAQAQWAGEGRDWDGITLQHVGFVRDGDTLACTCPLAIRGRLVCHRLLITRILALSGWSVVLDGEPVREHPAAFADLFLGEEP